MKVQFDINNPVGIIPYYKIYTVKMYRSVHSFGVFVLLLEVMYSLYSVYFAVHVFKDIYKKKRKYFKSVWNFLDIFVSCISFCVIFLYAVLYACVNGAAEEYQKTKRTKQFKSLYSLDFAITCLLALLVGLATLKFLTILRFNPTIHRFLAVVHRAKDNLSAAMIVMMLMHVPLASILHSMAGYWMYEYSNPSRAVVSLLTTTVLGKLSIETLEEAFPFWGPLLLISFLFTMNFIVLNLLISVLCDSVSEVFREKLPNEDAKILQLLINKILMWFGIRRH